MLTTLRGLLLVEPPASWPGGWSGLLLPRQSPVYSCMSTIGGVSQTGTTGALLTLGQTLILAFIALVGIGTALYDPEQLANFKPFLPHGWTMLLVTMGFTYVAFEGFEVIAQTGDEAIEPRRNLPKAMLYSILIVVLTYVGVSFASLVVVKDVGEPAWA